MAPFVATHYADEAGLAAYTAPAYDLIEPAERARLTAADPRSIVHLTLPTFGAADAAARLAAWRADGTLVVDGGPALFVYDLAGPGPQPPTRGWIGAVALAPPPVVAPHEATMAGVVADRRALRSATRADLEPVVLAHDGPPGAAAALARTAVAERAPVVDLTDDAGVRHRLWRVADPGEVVAVRGDVAERRAVIADGHHRWAAAARDEPGRGAAAPDGPGGPAAPGMGPAEAPRRGCSRCSCQLASTGRRCAPSTACCRAPRSTGWTSATSTARRWTRSPRPRPRSVLARAAASLVLLTDGERWMRLTAPASSAVTPAAWRELDVALVDVLLVADSAVLLRHSVAAAVEEARATRGVALLVRPTPTATVLELAARGVLMPRKSTFFVPKPRTGLVLRCFADQC